MLVERIFRKQNVLFNNNSFSVINKITAGVPQGAAISPLLFSIFINDIPILHKKNRDNSLLFADDLFYMNYFINLAIREII